MSDTMIVACPACSTLNRVARERLGAGARKCGSPLFAAAPVTLTSRNFDAHAARSGLPLLVDFWAAWCGPCRQMAPAFAAAAGQLEPEMRLGKLDTEAEGAIAARFGIQSIPTLVLIRGGREIARKAGAMPAGAITAWARQAAGGGRPPSASRILRPQR
ncbi:thioredoxin [Novosphingobium panipatense]|uniref:thioredoxin n=1 Tax=Novosphingobium panipatense TaxID=428991 RepID=UPI003623A5E7